MKACMSEHDPPKKRYTFILPPESMKMPKRALLAGVCHSDGDVLVMCLVDFSDQKRPKVLNAMPMADAIAWLQSILEPSTGPTH